MKGSELKFLFNKIEIKMKSFTINIESRAFSDSRITKTNVSGVNVIQVRHYNNSIICKIDEKEQSFQNAAKDNNLGNTNLGNNNTGNTNKDNVPTNQSHQNNNPLDTALLNEENNLQFLKLIEDLQLRLSKIEDTKVIAKSQNEDEDNGGSNTPKLNKSFSEDDRIISNKEQILDTKELQMIDFILQCKESQDEVDSVFEFKVLQYGKKIVPDNMLSHLKSPVNREILSKNEILSFKLKIWYNIYDIYFKSIFKIISKLDPINSKYFRNMNTLLYKKGLFQTTPASRMLYAYDSPLAKIVYGYANGLYDLSCFLPTKFHKLEIKYKFSTTEINKDSKGVTSDNIILNWYYYENNKELKFQYATDVKDFSYEYSAQHGDFKFNQESTLFNKSQDNIYSAMFDLNSDTKVKSMQMGTSTRMGIGITDQETTIVQGFVSRMIVNGNISFDITNSQLFNSLSTLLAVEYLNIDFYNIESSEIIKEISQYVATMIHQFAADRIYPKNTLISDVFCDVTICKNENFRTDEQLHTLYKDLVSKGHILPITPVQFDYYFHKDTIIKFSEYIVLSSISNVSINPEFDSVLPVNNSISKRNFSLYCRDRNSLNSKYYSSNPLFDFQEDNISLDFDKFLIELYVRNVIISKIPDYLPLISRGQWSTGEIKSLNIYSSYLNDYWVKFHLHNSNDAIDEFVNDILVINSEFRLDKNFKNKTRLTEKCPEIFSRFLLSNNLYFSQIGVNSKSEEIEEDQHE